jgi:hypothetical protein
MAFQKLSTRNRDVIARQDEENKALAKAWNSFMNYRAEPTLAKFHQAGNDIQKGLVDVKTGTKLRERKNYVRAVMGCVGSGKSVACCMEIMFRAIQQPPGPDGVRRSRIAIVRDTYKNLKDTTLQTWLAWFPEGGVSHVNWTPPISVQVGIEKPGIKGRVIPLADGTFVQLELKCLGLENGEKAMEDLKSLELTGAWVNECQAIRLPLINQLIQRVGRYPGGNDDPEKQSISYVIMDTNPPNIGNWYHELAEKKKPEGWTFFRQPPALLWEETETGEIKYEPNVGQRAGIPPAENISHHSEGWDYYLKGVGSQSDEFTKVFMCGEYGDTSGGKPVYTQYKDAVHFVDAPFEFVRGAPLILGFDYGLTPACAICQLTDRGGVRVLEEVLGDNIGIKGFFEQQLRPRLVNDYGWGTGTVLYAVGDPAGDFRKDTDESTAAGVLRQFGVPVVPCVTNANSARIESVRTLLSRFSDGKRPDLQISNRCPVLREGFLGNYRYATIKGLNTARLREVPEKNEYSHIHDALQYACHLILNPALYDVTFRGARQPKYAQQSSPYGGKVVSLAGFF